MSDALRDILVEVIVEVVYDAGLKIPKPLIGTAVRSIIGALPEFDLTAASQRVMEMLGYPRLADQVAKLFVERADDVAWEVKCPETGDTIALEKGDGTYSCPDCDQDIEVENGAATHAYEIECPVEDTTVWVGPEEATYECPECGGEIVVEDGEVEHTYAEVTCPKSGGTISLTEGDGAYSCPDCGEEIVVEDGGAEHAQGSGRDSRRRRRARK